MLTKGIHVLELTLEPVLQMVVLFIVSAAQTGMTLSKNIYININIYFFLKASVYAILEVSNYNVSVTKWCWFFFSLKLISLIYLHCRFNTIKVLKIPLLFTLYRKWQPSKSCSMTLQVTGVTSKSPIGSKVSWDQDFFKFHLCFSHIFDTTGKWYLSQHSTGSPVSNESLNCILWGIG